LFLPDPSFFIDLYQKIGHFHEGEEVYSLTVELVENLKKMLRGNLRQIMGEG
jgi:hypothetical protein